MKKKSKQKIASKRVVPSGKKDEGQSYIRFDPFDGISRDQLLRGFQELGEQSTANFKSEFESLTANVLRSNPLSLLSILAHYGMSQYIDDKGDSQKRENWISQHHVELLQAIILAHDIDEYGFEPTFPPLVQEIWNNLLRVSESFQTGRYRDLGRDDEEEIKRKRAIQEWLRLHTQCVRNWGYLDKVVEIMNGLVMPLEEAFVANLGVSFPLLFHFARSLISEIENKSTENYLKMRRVFKSKDLEQLVQSYYLEFPDMKGDDSKLISKLEADQVDLKQAKYILMSHNEQSFYDFFDFDVNDVDALLLPGYTSRDLLTSLDAISLSFGSLKSANQEHVFLDNPCWKRPVIKLDTTTYFWPLPMLLFSFCQDIVENVLSCDKALLNKYYDRRAEFLEDRVAYIFKSQFPSCKIFRGSLWRDPVSGREYENDLLVIIDCFAIVVEAKSGRVTDPAKRGALPRLERTINDLIESASIQSERFAAMIGSIKNVINFRTINGGKNSVDLSHVTKVARLTVLLDDIATIQSRIRELKEAGIIDDSISIAPTMLISDLETVIDILETPAIFLHYLLRRNEIQVNSVMIGDELDILAFYLDTGFNIGDSEYDNDTHLYLTGMSSKIDKYNEFKTRLKDVRKPSLRMTKWWRDIITQLENRNTYRWLEIAIKLLNVAYDDQQKVEKKFASIKKQVKANWFRKGHLNCVMFCSGPADRRDAFVFLAYRDRHSDKRHEWASNASASIMEEHLLTEALALGINIDIGHYPYSFIAMCAPNSHG